MRTLNHGVPPLGPPKSVKNSKGIFVGKTEFDFSNTTDYRPKKLMIPQLRSIEVED